MYRLLVERGWLRVLSMQAVALWNHLAQLRRAEAEAGYPMRELALEFGVGHVTLYERLRELEDNGLVTVERHGRRHPLQITLVTNIPVAPLERVTREA
ncbi:MAG TPA: hypothetical protein VGN26_04050 [Armatimonadota bacterium]